MIVTIDISENYIEVLSKWASVSRTLGESKKLLEDYYDLYNDEWGFSGDKSKQEEINHNIGELEQITPALDHIHNAVRSQIWKQIEK